MSSRFRELPAIALAVLLHGAFFGVARSLPEMNLLLERSWNEDAGLLWLDTEDTDATRPAALKSEEPPVRDNAEPVPPERTEAAVKDEKATPHAAASEKLAAANTDAANAPAVLAAPAAAADAASVSPESAAIAPPSDGFSPLEAEASPFGSLSSLFTPGAPLGLAGQMAIAGAGSTAAPTTTPAAQRADGSTVNKLLSSTLLGQTRGKGIDLPATQVVVGTVSAATRTLAVPHNTRASFTVKLGPGGKVLGVKVSSASAGDAAAWDGAAKAVAGQLASKALGLGDAAGSGATVVVSVTVRHVFPTGSAKGADIKPVCANQFLNDIVDAADKKPTAAAEGTIPLFQDENGRPCIPIGVGGTADAANIGATKQIQVTTTTRVLVDGKEALPLDIKPVNKDWVDTGKGGPRPVLPQKMRKYKADREKKK